LISFAVILTAPQRQLAVELNIYILSFINRQTVRGQIL
jgi:hypothetical protein